MRHYAMPNTTRYQIFISSDIVLQSRHSCSISTVIYLYLIINTLHIFISRLLCITSNVVRIYKSSLILGVFSIKKRGIF